MPIVSGLGAVRGELGNDLWPCGCRTDGAGDLRRSDPQGRQAGSLPVERPTKVDLVVNLKTAKTLGLTIPPSVLARADEIIQ